MKKREIRGSPLWGLPLNKQMIIGLILLSIVIVLGICSDWLRPYDSLKQFLVEEPLSPSKNHILGTDNLGRDILSRILDGIQLTLSLALVISLTTVILGVSLGVIFAYSGGVVDIIGVGVMDIFLAFPYLLLAIGIASALGPGATTIFISLVVAGWAPVARLTRSLVLRLKEKDYIYAVKILGGSNLRIIFKHLIPNLLDNILVIYTLNFAMCVLAEASLSFLGLGIQPPWPSLGKMVYEGGAYLRSAPWWPIYPGLTIAVIILSLNFIGDGLRDILDVREGL